MLPFARGGFGLRSTALHAPAAFISSVNGCRSLMSKLVPSVSMSVLFDVEVMFAKSKLLLCVNVISSSSNIDSLMIAKSQKFISSALDDSAFASLLRVLPPVDKARVLALQDSPQGLILDVPLDKVSGFALSNQDVRFFVSSRLGLSNLCNDGDICPLCKEEMDASGYHMAICHKGPSIVHRHHSVRDLVADFCSKAAWSPSIEFPCFESSDLTPADVYLPRGGSAGGPLAIDVLVIHPLQQAVLPKSAIESGQGCLHGESKKHLKYDLLCDQEGIDFLPLVAEYFGTWGKEAQAFFVKLSKAIAGRSGVSISEVALEMQRKLAICLVRCNAKAVAKRTPILLD
jgi:hypothetical protein